MKSYSTPAFSISVALDAHFWESGSFPALIGKLRYPDTASSITGLALRRDSRFLLVSESDAVHLYSLENRGRSLRWRLGHYWAPGTAFAFSEGEQAVLCRIPNGDFGYIPLPTVP